MSERLRPDSLHIVVTSGGTDVPIDDVRVISNISSGTTGALITETALERGHSVDLLRHRHAKRPFERDLRADPNTEDINAEAERIRGELTRIAPLMSHFTDRPQSDFDAYHAEVLRAVADPSVDVAIMSRAASDFGVKKTDGKISSDKDGLHLEMTPLPKIISEIIPSRRDIFLVGFKYLAEGTSPDALIEAAYKSLLRDKQDLAVANAGRMGTDQLLTYLVTLEKGVIPVGARGNLQEVLLETIEQRHSKKHYKTELKKVDELPVNLEEVNGFLGEIHRLSHLALFAEYLRGDREEFGFVAKRTGRGTLITGRGSSKSKASVDDLALITGIDEARRVMTVESTGGKAALNANVAHRIMEEREDVNYIVHSHIPLPGADHATMQSSPGTQEDWDRMKDLVKSGSQVIYQPGHGVIVLLKSLDELVPMLSEKNIYAARPEYYDSAYARFQKSPRFMEIVKDGLARNGKYLDLAGGTGEVTRQLVDEGFSDITIADASGKMLQVAREKLPELEEDRFQIKAMEEMDDEGVYDGIFIRQAVNYIPQDRLADVFTRLKRAMKSGGRLVFNSFVAEGLVSDLKEVRREQVGPTITLTREGNIIENGTVIHGQRTEVFDVKSGAYEIVYDLNKFNMYDATTFEQALKDGGFEDIEVIQEGRSLYFRAR